MTDWSITITDNQGGTHTPHIYAPPGVAYPLEIPAANGVPTLQFGVLPKSGSESWFDAKFENCDVTVTADKNGDGTFVTQPYSRLIGPSSESSQGIIELSADGGRELQQRVDESFGVVETHSAAETVVTNNTSYGVDIPTPTTTTSTGEMVRDRSTGLSSDDLVPQPEDSPAHIDGNGHLTLHQTLFFHDNSATLSSVGDVIEFTFTTDYYWPADRVSMAFNTDIGAHLNGVEMAIDGNVLGEIEPGGDVGGRGWVNFEGGKNELAPGQHTARFEVTETEDESGAPTQSIFPDGVCVYDNKFLYTFDPDLVDGPQLFPGQYQGTYASLPRAIVTRAVTGATVTPTWQDDNPGFLVVGNGEFSTGGNTGGPVSFSGQDRGAYVRVRVGLQAYGTDSTRTPESGYLCETLEDFTLTADLKTMPMVVDERYQGTVAEVLTELADTLRGDFVWTFDTDSNGDKKVRFVRTGARTSTENDIESFSIQKRTDTTLQEVKVLGGRVDVTGEGVRVDYGTPVALNRDDLTEGSETVERDGTVYERGVHYSMDYAAGTITFDGSPSNADAVPNNAIARVSYQFQPSGTVTAAGVSNPTRTRTVDSLPLRSDAACRLAAEQILQAAQSPTYDAQASVRGDTTFSVVSELVANRLPVSNLEPTSITATPAGADVRLEARQSPGEVVADVRDRITNVARHTR